MSDQRIVCFLTICITQPFQPFRVNFLWLLYSRYLLSQLDFFREMAEKNAVVKNAWIRYDANLKVASSRIIFLSSNKKDFCVFMN